MNMKYATALSLAEDIQRMDRRIAHLNSVVREYRILFGEIKEALDVEEPLHPSPIDWRAGIVHDLRQLEPRIDDVLRNLP